MKGYMGYELTKESKALILSLFPPKFPVVRTHHITESFDVEEKTLPQPQNIKVIGYACNHEIECVVVEIDGTSKREGWGTFHITISHNPNVFAVKSNEVIAKGFTKITPFEISANPKFFPFPVKKTNN